MSVLTRKLVEHIFFFAILTVSAYLVWLLFAPFVGALLLAAIVVTVCYPIHERILARVTYRSISALLSLLFVVLAVVVPFSLLASLILKEALSIYTLVNNDASFSLIESVAQLERFVQHIVPTFTIDVPGMIAQTASFVVTHFVGVFTATASTIFLFFIALIAAFYFFRDGRYFTEYLVRLSPLRDSYDERIIGRLAVAVRSVAVGTVFVALVQGVLTAIGLGIFGFDRAILWGCIAAVGALVPGLGTSLVFVPAVLYLVFTGAHLTAVFVAIWGMLAVGLIDNLLGPYVMSRGNKVHPFLILLSVLGGMALFGPIGFVLGPVTLSLFLVLIEIYHSHIQEEA